MVLGKLAHPPRKRRPEERLQVQQVDDSVRLASLPNMEVWSPVSHGVGEVDLQGDRSIAYDGWHLWNECIRLSPFSGILSQTEGCPRRNDWKTSAHRALPGRERVGLQGPRTAPPSRWRPAAKRPMRSCRYPAPPTEMTWLIQLPMTGEGAYATDVGIPRRLFNSAELAAGEPAVITSSRSSSHVEARSSSGSGCSGCRSAPRYV